MCGYVFVSFWDSNKEIWSNFDFSEWEPKTAKVVKTLQGYVGGAKERVSQAAERGAYKKKKMSVASSSGYW